MRDWTLAFKIRVILHEHFAGWSEPARRSTNAACSHKANGLFDLGRQQKLAEFAASVRREAERQGLGTAAATAVPNLYKFSDYLDGVYANAAARNLALPLRWTQAQQRPTQ